jgi:hypothetical protein
MNYLLLSEIEVESVVLTEKQQKLRAAVSRVLADEDPLKIAEELIEDQTIQIAEIAEIIDWVKKNRKPKKGKAVFRCLKRTKIGR